jgi:hypothetical protein
MADLDATGLDRFRRMAAIVGFPDRPPEVSTALALSGLRGPGANPAVPGGRGLLRAHPPPGADARGCVPAPRRGDARQGALDDVRRRPSAPGGPPRELAGRCDVDGQAVRRRDSVKWGPAQIEAGGIPYLAADGAEAVLWWDDAAQDPGWCKLDWVIEDAVDGRLVNVSNMLDVTWEAPDGTVTPLDGFLDPYFQEVYLETESIPLFSRLVKQMGADAVADYVTQLNGEVRHYTVDKPNYGKAARRLYNVFRLTGRYAEAAFIRELFDEPVTALYQVAALLRTLDEAAAGDASRVGDADAFGPRRSSPSSTA